MSDLININEADEATLTEISGIGESLAARIVEYRKTVHPFEEVIELAAVPGISERMVRAFEDLVTVAPVIPDTTPVPDEPEPSDEVLVAEVSTGEETAVSLPVEPIDAEEPEPVASPPAPIEAEAPEPIETLPEVIEEAPIEDEDIFDPEPVGERTEEQDILEEVTEESESEGDDETEPEPVEIEEPAAEPIATPEPDLLFREEPEPTMTTESTQTDLPETPPPPVNESVSQRRGCIFIIIGAVAGAILGMTLTLALLAGLNNGSLQYAQSNSRLQNQLESVTNSLDELSQELESANQNLEAVATRTGTLADDQSEMSEAINGVESTIGNAQQGLETAQDDIEALTETAVTLDERIDTISESAETFDTFLTGMRDLLVDLQGMPIPTRTPFATITPGADDVTATVAADEEETAVTPTSPPTRIPTRTPRPTSTPISLPTSTPAQQP